jgi:hypothetical protein
MSVRSDSPHDSPALTLKTESPLSTRNANTITESDSDSMSGIASVKGSTSMVRSHFFGRVGVAMAAAVAMSCSGVALAAAATTKAPAVVFSISNLNPEQNTTITVKACFANVPKGDVVEVDRAAGTSLVYRAIARVIPKTPSSCAKWAVNSGPIGVHPFRAVLLKGATPYLRTAPKTVRTFGRISGATFFTSLQLNADNSGTVSAGGHVFPMFDDWGVGNGRVDNPVSETFASKTTCRSLTLAMVTTNSLSGDPTSQEVVTMQLIQGSLDPESVTLTANNPTKKTFKLDGSIGQLQGWRVSSNENYGYVTFLSNQSWADCSSTTGV